MTTNELFDNVLDWAEGLGLTDSNHVERQMLKTVEEVGELAAAIARDDKKEAHDAIGDIMVTLIIMAEKLGTDARVCLSDVYEIISQRTGKTVNGVFIKEEP